jgi:hypothetical protein
VVSGMFPPRNIPGPALNENTTKQIPPMKTTDTPESDAAWDFAWGEGGCNEEHLLDVMEKLERQRNELIRAARECLLFPSNPATQKLRAAIAQATGHPGEQ